MRRVFKTFTMGLGLITLMYGAAAGAADSQLEPRIVRNGKDVTVEMTAPIEQTLYAWNSKAKILGMDNFPDEVWKLYTSKDPQSLPMVAIGDYNGDGKKDLGLLVTFNNRLQAIAIVSSGASYKVHEVRTFSLNNRSLFKLENRRIISQVYLFAEDQSKLKHKKRLKKRDGLQVEILNSADTRLFYLKGQQVAEYKGLIK